MSANQPSHEEATKLQQYIIDAIRTESVDLSAILGRLVTHPRTIRLLHAGIGMATESGELLDALKKHIFYGKPIDTVNLKEELGDQLWYIAVALHEMGWSFEEVAAINIAKLRARYPDKFSGYEALNRNLPAERALLEVGSISHEEHRKGTIVDPLMGEVPEPGADDIAPVHIVGRAHPLGSEYSYNIELTLVGEAAAEAHKAIDLVSRQRRHNRGSIYADKSTVGLESDEQEQPSKHHHPDPSI